MPSSQYTLNLTFEVKNEWDWWFSQRMYIFTDITEGCWQVSLHLLQL